MATDEGKRSRAANHTRPHRPRHWCFRVAAAVEIASFETRSPANDKVIDATGLPAKPKE